MRLRLFKPINLCLCVRLPLNYCDNADASTNDWDICGISSPTLRWGGPCCNDRRHQCPHCGLILLAGETPGFCCGVNGSRLHDVAPLPPLPPAFNTFLNNPDISKSSCILNLLFSFASMESTHEFPQFNRPAAMVTIQGKLYHRVRPHHRSSAMHWLLHDGFMLEKMPQKALAEDVPLAWIQTVCDTLHRCNPFV